MAYRGLAEDPIRNFKYQVRIGNNARSRSGFSRVAGLKETSEVVEYREGTDPARMRKLFGQVSYDNVTLEQGLTNDPTLWTWRRQIVDAAAGRGRDGGNEGNQNLGTEVRRDVTISLNEYHGRITWEWKLDNAWPTSLEMGEFAGDGNDVVVQTVELAHEGLVVRPPATGTPQTQGGT